MPKPLRIFQGESRPIILKLTEGRSAYPIPDDSTLFIAVKQDPKDDFYLFSIEDANIGRMGNGIISFVPTPAQTNLYPGVYKIQVMVISAVGEIAKTMLGEFEVLESLIPYGVVGEGAATLPVLVASAEG